MLDLPWWLGPSLRSPVSRTLAARGSPEVGGRMVEADGTTLEKVEVASQKAGAVGIKLMQQITGAK